MKKSILLILLVFLGLSLHCAEIEDFKEVVDFSLSIKRYDAAIQRNALNRINTDKFCILNGAISSITVKEPEVDNFFAIIELVNGEWQGLQDVKIFRCLVEVKGKEFAHRIPVRRRGERVRIFDKLEENNRVIIVAKFSHLETERFDNTVPVFDGYFVRTIE